MFGSREINKPNPFHGLIGRAMASDLAVLAVPGPELVRAFGLDLMAAGLRMASGPRDADILLLIPPLGKRMLNAASVVYGQMPRPRAVIVLGARDISPLPKADFAGELSQTDLIEGVDFLRKHFAMHAFSNSVKNFDAPALQSRVEYTCPMHPEVVSDEPGSCPKCGMDLVARETGANEDQPSEQSAKKNHSSSHAAHSHSSHVKTAPAKTNQDHKTQDHGTHGHHGHKKAQKEAGGDATRYTCPMHPEVVSDEPGSCPKCGMFLEPVKEEGNDHKTKKHKTQDHGAHGHHGHKKAQKEAGADATRYTCPMHPEVVSDEPGSCPKCGMFLEPVKEEGNDHKTKKHKTQDHGAHGHDSHGHHSHDVHGAKDSVSGLSGLEPGFMSMVEMTRGTPRSSDGLQMEWIKVPFGPFFPGLPSGLGLELTLDGDNVANARIDSFCDLPDPLENGPISADDYIKALQAQMPLAPLAYSLLACRAIEAAAGVANEDEDLRNAAIARERMASHLSWLTSLGHQLGIASIERKASKLQLLIIEADFETIISLTPELNRFSKQVRTTPFLRRRLSAIGNLPHGIEWNGPLTARNSYENNAFGRLMARLDDISQSLAMIEKTGAIGEIELVEIGNASGHGHANIDTARGRASLHVELEEGKLASARLDTPSMRHMDLVAPLTNQQELGDALVAMASIDISPWEIRV